MRRFVMLAAQEVDDQRSAVVWVMSVKRAAAYAPLRVTDGRFHDVAAVDGRSCEAPCTLFFRIGLLVFRHGSKVDFSATRRSRFLAAFSAALFDIGVIPGSTPRTSGFGVSSVSLSAPFGVAGFADITVLPSFTAFLEQLDRLGFAALDAASELGCWGRLKKQNARTWLDPGACYAVDRFEHWLATRLP